MEDFRVPATPEARALAQSPRGRLPAHLEPASRAEVCAHLAGCLAIVRPVSMTDEMAEEWISVGANDLKGRFPNDILEEACRLAREEADHHSKMLKAIIANARQLLERQRHRSRGEIVALPAPRKAPPLTESDLEFLNGDGQLARSMRRIGIAAGSLIENEDGSVSLAQ